MKKSLLAKLCILSLVVVCAAMSFVACKVTTKSITVNGKSQVFAGEFALADYLLTVSTSDGNTRTEPLTAQNLANVTVEQLQRAGMYNISVVYDGVTTTFALTVVNRTFDGLTFADKTVTYNGSAQSIEVANLPQGATVAYSPTSTFTNAGIYPVTATVSAPNFDTATLSATLTINKASYDMSKVVFADKSVAYDGNAHSLEATNLPDGVTVTYIGNNQTNVGTYTVLAVFSGDSANYNPIANMTATLTITPCGIKGITFAGKTVTYDGSVHSIAIEGTLPEGVTVSYQNNGKTNAGTYTVIAHFTSTNDNYNTLADMTATLIIEKATYDMSQVVFENKSVTYDGTTHSLETTNLPDGVTVIYLGNNQTNVGKYNVVAIFSGDSVNYNPIANKNVTLSIEKAQYDMSQVRFEWNSLTYDGNTHALAIEGTLPQGVTVTYKNNNQTNAGVYTVTAKFVGSNPNYEHPADMTATLTIEKKELQIEFIGSTTFVYDGNAHKSLTARATNLCGSDTVNISIAYNGDVVEAGSYTATATVDSANYKLTQNNACTITITRATHTVTFRQQGQEDKVFSVLDLADFAESIPQVVPVAGYTVVWETKDLTRVTEDIVVDAIITPVEYRITYVLDGGTNPDDAPNSYTIESATFTLPTPTKRGYTFDGWHTEDTFENKVEQIANGSIGDVTLHAKWTVITYLLTIDLDGGALKDDLHSQFTVKDLPLALPHCYKKDYTFTGWKLGNGENISELNITANVTIKAVFAEGTEGLVYSLQDNHYVVSGYTGSVTDVVIPSKWQNLEVTTIDAYAFQGQNSLTSVTIPTSVTKIAYYAFKNCTSLTTVYWNATNYTFASSDAKSIFTSCPYLNTVVFGENVQNIPAYVFSDCTSLANITMSNSVTSIGSEAFYRCTGLTSVTIGNGVASIGYSAFDGCVNLANITIGNGVTSIGNGAFRGCTGITNIDIPNSVTEIGDHAFGGCTALTNITIPNSITSIGGIAAFGGCMGITNITIPNSVTEIGESTFA